MATPKLAIRRADFEMPEDLAPALERLSAGDFDSGHQLLLEARQRHPHDPKAANFLGMLHFNSGRIEQARVEFSCAARLAPGVGVYAYNEATASLMTGRPREALSAYLQSLNGDELLADAHRWAWTALSDCGKLEIARSRLREALRRDNSPQDLDPRPQQSDLAGVTLCAIDCIDADLAARSLWRSMAHCRFGAVKLLTSRHCAYDGIETVPIDPIGSLEEYSRFVVKSLYRYIDTGFALVTQWDGYVVNGDAWSGDFLDYDFIGATWDEYQVRSWGIPPSHNVGNGGFSLRSARLLRAGVDPRITRTNPEDMSLGGTYRPYLERQHGIRFADAAIADRFSFEANQPDAIPFGFHGHFNLCCFEAAPYWMRFGFLDAADLA